jgi:hypothetical protein
MTPDEWILLPGGTYVGSSSATIWAALTGKKMPFGWHPDVPLDPDDFRRCHQLLMLIPGWRARIAEVATRFPEWAPFVEAWDELERLYLEAMHPENASEKKKWDPLYDRMCAIRDVRRGDGPTLEVRFVYPTKEEKTR